MGMRGISNCKDFPQFAKMTKLLILNVSERFKMAPVARQFFTAVQFCQMFGKFCKFSEAQTSARVLQATA